MGKLEILLATSTEYTLYAKWLKKKIRKSIIMKKFENKGIWSVKNSAVRFCTGNMSGGLE